MNMCHNLQRMKLATMTERNVDCGDRDVCSDSTKAKAEVTWVSMTYVGLGPPVGRTPRWTSVGPGPKS